MMLLSSLLSTLFLPLTLGFSFSIDSSGLKQCGTASVSWNGGTPPFYLTLIPAYDYPQNLSIPDSAWSSDSSSGQYDWTVNYPGGTRFAAMMSDSTGLGTGGVSPLYNISNSSTTCTMRSTAVDFYFYLNETTVEQCNNVEIYWDNTATDPVTILGIIPSGQPFQFSSVGSSTSLLWNTNIAAGTQFILASFDAGKNKQGGSSDLLTVGPSSNSACVDDSSPSSTPVSSETATSTKTGGGGAVKTVTAIATVGPSGGAGLKTGAIVGIVVAAVFTLLILQAILFWFCCRRQVVALLTHRRQMRGRGLKAGDVDLVSQDRSSVILQDPSTTDLTPGPRSRSSMVLTGTRGARSSVGDAYEVESSISPFWDGARVPQESDGMLPPIAGLGSPIEDDMGLLPPGRPHLRTESIDSAGSRPVSTHDLHYLMNPSPTSPAYSPSSSRPRQPQLTKAQMAAALAATNPDSISPSGAATGPSSRPEELQGFLQPPQEAPPGGFRRHEDAGPLQQDVEELPPLYRPEWETESQRGRDGRERPQE